MTPAPATALLPGHPPLPDDLVGNRVKGAIRFHRRGVLAHITNAPLARSMLEIYLDVQSVSRIRGRLASFIAIDIACATAISVGIHNAVLLPSELQVSIPHILEPSRCIGVKIDGWIMFDRRYSCATYLMSFDGVGSGARGERRAWRPRRAPRRRVWISWRSPCLATSAGAGPVAKQSPKRRDSRAFPLATVLLFRGRPGMGRRFGLFGDGRSVRAGGRGVNVCYKKSEAVPRCQPDTPLGKRRGPPSGPLCSRRPQSRALALKADSRNARSLPAMYQEDGIVFDVAPRGPSWKPLPRGSAASPEDAAGPADRPGSGNLGRRQLRRRTGTRSP